MMRRSRSDPALRPSRAADVCFVIEGAYPYVMGGVSGWTHALIESIPDLRVAVVAIRARADGSVPVYELPGNVVGLHDVHLDEHRGGRRSIFGTRATVTRFHRLCLDVFLGGAAESFAELRTLLVSSRPRHDLLTDSRHAWLAIRDIYTEVMPSSSLLQFFWAWRALVSGFLVSLTCPLPDARVYHAISTGYAGVVGARASLDTGSPLLVTEHGIYTNERRIELQLADWLHDTGRGGYSASGDGGEIRDLWMSAFSGFARTTYERAHAITTLYTGNQAFQMADGAPSEKLSVIPNGVDADRLRSFRAGKRHASDDRPTVALIGRIVPIKDIRTFIEACAALCKRVPDVAALLLGPDDEDPDYASECRALVHSLGLERTVRICGRVDVGDYLPSIDVLVLTSLSEAQPLVLLEAGGAGIPSVATDVGSCREIIEGFAGDPVVGAGGHIVPCGDSEATARAVARLLLDPALRRRMGEVMSRRVSVTYNKASIDARYRALYERSMTSRPWPA